MISLILFIDTHLLKQHSLEPTGDVLLPVIRQLSQQSYFWCVCIDVRYRVMETGWKTNWENNKSECAHQELHFIIRAMSGAHKVISLWWFASIVNQLRWVLRNARWPPLILILPCLPLQLERPAYFSSVFLHLQSVLEMTTAAINTQ